jgi:transglutaminase-like putative cysteine protease
MTRRPRSRSGGPPLAVRLSLALALALPGCCTLIEPPEPEDYPRRRDVDPTPRPGDVDLGVAAYPRAEPDGKPSRFRFPAPPLRPKYYRAAYALTDAERRDLRDSLARFASSVGYSPSGKDKFSWSPPAGCNRDMRCVFEAIVARNAADIEPLAERFRRRAREANLTSLEAAQLVMSFVQHIKYEIPRESPFGVLPPAIVVSDKRGDCDSKALLALLILRHLGIDSVILSSDAHRHAMLGIALPTQGTTIEYGGRRYAFTEATAPGWPIGRMDPKLTRPNDWRVTPIRVKASPAKAPKKKTR